MLRAEVRVGMPGLPAMTWWFGRNGSLKTRDLFSPPRLAVGCAVEWQLDTVFQNEGYKIPVLKHYLLIPTPHRSCGIAKQNKGNGGAEQGNVHSSCLG